MSEQRSFHVSQRNGVTVVALTKARYADNDVFELESNLLDLVKREHPQKVLIDMATLEMSTNAVHSAFLKTQKLIEHSGGNLKLCNPSPIVTEALKITLLLDNIFEVHSSSDLALAAFADEV